MLRPISIRRFSFSLLFVGMGLGGWGASAQESINYASVSGRVTDPTGAVIEGVGVTAHQIDTNLASTAPERVGCPKVLPGSAAAEISKSLGHHRRAESDRAVNGAGRDEKLQERTARQDDKLNCGRFNWMPP
jgi:hypothetical protein